MNSKAIEELMDDSVELLKRMDHNDQGYCNVLNDLNQMADLVSKLQRNEAAQIDIANRAADQIKRDTIEYRKVDIEERRLELEAAAQNDHKKERLIDGAILLAGIGLAAYADQMQVIGKEAWQLAMKLVKR